MIVIVSSTCNYNRLLHLIVCSKFSRQFMKMMCMRVDYRRHQAHLIPLVNLLHRFYSLLNSTRMLTTTTTRPHPMRHTQYHGSIHKSHHLLPLILSSKRSLNQSMCALKNKNCCDNAFPPARITIRTLHSFLSPITHLMCVSCCSRADVLTDVKIRCLVSYHEIDQLCKQLNFDLGAYLYKD